MVTPTVKIISLETENFKRLRAVRMHVNDGITVVAGQNAAGKSSVLDSIAAALGGGANIPDKPLRKGAKKGQIIVETDSITVRRTITETGSTLTVTAKDGTTLKSPQQILDAMVGDLTFDPFEFTRMKLADQIGALKRAAGVEEQFAKLDREKKEAEDKRRDAGRERDRLKAVVGSMQVLDKDAQPVDTGAVLEELGKARATVAENQKARDGLKKVQDTLAGLVTAREGFEREIASINEKIARGTAWLNENASKIGAEADPDVAGLERKLADAGQINQRAQQAEQYRKATAELEAATATYDAQQRVLDDITEDRESVLRASPLPVKGLTFTDDALLLNSIPFAQASTSEQIRASVGIAMAQKPTLRLMLVRDGSLLDDAAMKDLAALAAEHGAQVLVERVGNDAGGMGVVIVDGEVES